jgi:hypothetical protein
VVMASSWARITWFSYASRREWIRSETWRSTAPAEVVQGGAATWLQRLAIDQAREGKRKTMTNTSDWWVPLEIESVSSPGSLAGPDRWASAK